MTTLPSISNKVYVDPDGIDDFGFAPPPFAVGPNTGGVGVIGPSGGYDEGATTFDCYGYGADDDVPGLVIIANVGGARFFDQSMNNVNPMAVRNMAGLLSSVAFEISDFGGKSAIVARMRSSYALAPIRFADMFFSIPSNSGFYPTAGYTLTTQIDGETSTTGVVGVENAAGAINAIREQFDDLYEVTITAALVDGIAPEIITDVNNDGIFDAVDIEATGATLLSTVDTLTIRQVSFDALAVTDEEECMRSSGSFGSDSRLFIDLDGDNYVATCQDGDGTSRSGVRRPR